MTWHLLQKNKLLKRHLNGTLCEWDITLHNGCKMASLSSFKVYTWRYTTSFIPCLITVGEKASNSWCHILQGKVYTHFTLSYPSSSFILDYHTLPLHLSFCVSFTFAASITFEESQIFHSHAGGRFPSMWVDSINLRWFAFLKLDKRNTLCNPGNAFCINPVLEYIFENPTHHIPFFWVFASKQIYQAVSV